MRELDGRVVVVTGAASGLGLECATALARAGARAVLADLNATAAEEAATALRDTGLDAQAHRLDVSEEASVCDMVSAVLKEYGAIDAILNNAAATSVASTERGILDASVAEWDATFAVNVRGPMLCCKHVIPAMLKRGQGSVINVSSVASLAGDFSGFAYAASKGAINILTKYVATSFGRGGIRCNAILPGLILTERVKSWPQEARRLWEENTPAPTLASPRDIGALSVFLASDDSRFINGQLIAVDGGFSVRSPNARIPAGS